MARRKVHTFDEFLASTPTEWEELPNGIRLSAKDDAVKVGPDRLIIDLPGRVAREFRPRERLTARVSRGQLIVERSPAKRFKRSTRRAD